MNKYYLEDYPLEPEKKGNDSSAVRSVRLATHRIEDREVFDRSSTACIWRLDF